MRAALADLKVLHETGLLDDDSYVAAQQKWVARLAAGDVQEDDGDEKSTGGEADESEVATAVAQSSSAALFAALPTAPSDEHDVRRKRRKE
eukprot:COSAG02_NODE_3653_length_6413_cov_4.685144_8_plen_90_part_01